MESKTADAASQGPDNTSTKPNLWVDVESPLPLLSRSASSGDAEAHSVYGSDRRLRTSSRHSADGRSVGSRSPRLGGGSHTPPPRLRHKVRTFRPKPPPRLTPTLRHTGSYHEAFFSTHASDKVYRAFGRQSRSPVQADQLHEEGESDDASASSAASHSRPLTTQPNDDGDGVSLCRLALLAGFGLPINVGWAVGEALIIPRLLQLGVSKGVASLVFLIDPVFGVFLQPVFGVMSDQCTSRWGRRRPFIMAFTATVCLGMVLVMYGVELSHALMHTPPLTLITAIMFFGYGMLDLSADLLVVPSRSLLVDKASDAQLQRAVAWWSAMSNLGRFAGLGLATLPLQDFSPWHLLDWDHLRSVYSVAALLFLVYNSFVCFTTPTQRKRSRSRVSSQAPTDATPLLSVTSQRSRDESSDSESDSSTEPGLCESLRGLMDMPRDVVLVFLVQSAGWIAFLVQCFYWTSWVPTVAFGGSPGVRWGTLTLASQSLAAFLLGYALPWVNETFGTRKVFYVTQLWFMAVTACVCLSFFQNKWGALALAIATSPLPAVQGDNAYILVEEAVDPEDRATYVSVLNLSMVVCQIITSLGGAVFLATVGDLTLTIAGFAGIGAFLTLGVLIYELTFVRPWLREPEGRFH